MDAGVWLAGIGLLITNVTAVFVAVVKHAKTEARVDAKLKEFEVALARGDARFQRIDRKLDGLTTCLTGIKVELARLAGQLDSEKRAG